MKKKAIMKQRKLFVIGTVIFSIVLSLAGCGSSGSSAQYDTAMGTMMSESYAPAEYAEYEEGSYGMANSDGYESEGLQSAAAEVSSSRKLIRTVNLDVETREYDLVMESIEERVEQLGGYIENMENYNGSSYSYSRPTRYANLTLRIPESNLDTFLNDVSQISNVVRRTESVEDITLSYVDLESHRDSLKVEQERLLELLKQAESVEEILTIEERLSEVRYRLESMESQLRTYDNKIHYSTIYLNVDEVETLTPVEEETIWQRISGGFLEDLSDVAEGLLNFVIWFITHIPSLVVWAAIITGIVFAIRACRKAGKKRKLKKAMKMTATQMPQTLQNAEAPAQNTQNPSDRIR